ncbi:MAG: hypothetical protein M1588_03970 [Planctomycetes bacterium]|nr:hypothetical protein [Planctomycetota bacterium]
MFSRLDNGAGGVGVLPRRGIDPGVIRHSDGPEAGGGAVRSPAESAVIFTSRLNDYPGIAVKGYELSWLISRC